MVNRQLNTRAAWLIAVAVAALTACSLLAAPAGASLRGGAPAKRIAASEFTAVSCPAANDCWAVGRVNDGGHAEIAHWDGSAWTQFPLKHRFAGFTSLNSVSCSSASLCWAVGVRGDASYLLRWNGTRWSSGPDIGGTPSAVFCVSRADCWVAGGVKMEHWNGSRWAAVPAPPVFDDPFRPGLYCVSSSDCWVTATKLNEHGVIIGHWNGHAWRTVHNPASEDHDVSMSGLSCLGATACLAAGDVAVSWDGSKWSRADAGLAANASLGAVSCTAGLPCLAVGLNSVDVAFSERWDGAQWHPVTTPAPPGTNSELNGISCVTASDCWAVGDQFNATTTLNLIEHWDGTAWSVFS